MSAFRPETGLICDICDPRSDTDYRVGFSLSLGRSDPFAAPSAMTAICAQLPLTRRSRGHSKSRRWTSQSRGKRPVQANARASPQAHSSEEMSEHPGRCDPDHDGRESRKAPSHDDGRRKSKEIGGTVTVHRSSNLASGQRNHRTRVAITFTL